MELVARFKKNGRTVATCIGYGSWVDGHFFVTNSPTGRGNLEGADSMTVQVAGFPECPCSYYFKTTVKDDDALIHLEWADNKALTVTSMEAMP